MSDKVFKSVSSTLSPWAKGILPSPTLIVDARAKAMKAEGRDVCGFGAGEPDFDTPQFIKDAAVKALNEGRTKYAPAAGLPELRSALAEKYRSFNQTPWVQPGNVIVSPGGKFSCYLSLLAVSGPGDDVIIPTPYWVSYPEMVKLTGANPIILPTTLSDGFKLTPEKLREAITPKTRCFILNSPSNPSGVVYSPEELSVLSKICFENGVYILSDEIYEHLIYGTGKPFSPASLGEDGQRWVITVSGFSKSFSMTGWRLGTTVANETIARAIMDLQSQTTSNATTFAQYGALAALTQKDDAKAALLSMHEVFDRRRKRLIEGLNSIPGIDCPVAEGAFYVFPSIEKVGLSADAFAEAILEEEEVAVVSGEGFGVPGHIRLSYAVSDDVIEKGLERIARFCQNKLS